jgi:hypothetical protein
LGNVLFVTELFVFPHLKVKTSIASEWRFRFHFTGTYTLYSQVQTQWDNQNIWSVSVLSSVLWKVPTTPLNRILFSVWNPVKNPFEKGLWQHSDFQLVVFVLCGDCDLQHDVHQITVVTYMVIWTQTSARNQHSVRIHLSQSRSQEIIFVEYTKPLNQFTLSGRLCCSLQSEFSVGTVLQFHCKLKDGLIILLLIMIWLNWQT